MQTKKLFFFSILLLIPFLGQSQIITSKKEAIKKGVYVKPSEKKEVTANTANSVKTTIIAAQPKPAIAAAKPAETAKPAAQKSKKYLINDKEDTDLIIEPQDNYLATQMINNAMSFIGVHYHGGGTSVAGMDCSGMVTAVFNIFDIKLPRSSNEMSRVGEKLDRKDIRKGDLVFFRTRGKHVINHVGMVVEANADEIKFIHSSTNSGVIVSSTKEPYYARTFAQANRVL